VKAIILFSGGLDSTVLLAMAHEKQRTCIAVSFDYNQRHKIELTHAKIIAAQYGCEHRIIKIDREIFSGSALVNDAPVAKNRSAEEIARSGTPSTYVPARNTLFLAYATAIAETTQAGEIYFGPNALDCLPYIDCRPAYIQAYQQVLNLATKEAIEGTPPQLLTPLINWDKKRIVQEGLRLGVPLHLTYSCYDPVNDLPCEQCDACVLRKEALASLSSSVSY